MGIRTKLPRRLGALCTLALICAWGIAGAAEGQDPASNSQNNISKTPAQMSAGKHTKKNTATAAPRQESSNATKSHASGAPAHNSSGASTAANSKPSSTVTGKRKPRSGRAKLSAARKKGNRRTTAHAQRKIDSERAQEIQQALIREHYFSGEASGVWNQASEDAMRRYQADHGWQSKTVPDARALISLGLGPSHDHLLNPESAMTSGPEPPHAASLSPVSASPHSAAQSENSVANVPSRDSSKTSAAPASDPPPAHNPSSPQ